MTITTGITTKRWSGNKNQAATTKTSPIFNVGRLAMTVRASAARLADESQLLDALEKATRGVGDQQALPLAIDDEIIVGRQEFTDGFVG